jgi:hypothetical protein
MFTKRKHNRGRIISNSKIWVFGGVDNTTGECFMVQVAKRNADTLLE